MRLVAQLRAQPSAPRTFERLLTSADGFGLGTASSLQRAIARIADGQPLGELRTHPDVVDAIGSVDQVEGQKPHELVILSGIRTGKSLMAAALAVHWSQTCDVSLLGAGEIPRVSVVSITLDLANVIFNHILGNVQGSPVLSKLLVGQPTADTIILRHPSGKHVEIKVVAGKKAGASLVARWSAGCIFDEAPRMAGADDGVINYDDSRKAVLERLLPGSQLVSIGSPWAPFGPIYEAYNTSWRKPVQRLVIIRAPGWRMNPVFWTPERCERLRKSEPDVYATDCAAEFASPEESLFSSVELDRATRLAPTELPPEDRHEYSAAMDPATRGNSWTLIVSTRIGNLKRICLARQWTGSRLDPLNPRDVLSQIAALVKPYRIHGVYTDQWFGDALAELAKDHGLMLWQDTMTTQERTQKYLNLRTKVSIGEVELSPEPMLRSDLMRLKKRTTNTGVQIVLPRTSDGRHCDYAPAVVLSMARWLDDVAPLPIVDGSREALRREIDASKMRAEKRYGNRRARWERS